LLHLHGSFGEISTAFHNDGPEALLAASDTSAAQDIMIDPSQIVEEEIQFLLALFAMRGI